MSAAFSRVPQVIFVNRFYWPDEPATGQLLTDLAELLAERGLEVKVIASHNGQAGLPRVELRHGVNICRVSRNPVRQPGTAGKAVAFATFSIAVLWKLLFTLQHGDRVVVLTDPPLLGIGVWLVARLRGARIYHWVQDVYPEVASALTGHSWLALLTPMRNLAWRRSDGCVTLGSDMAGTLARAGVAADKITISPNWAPVGLGPPVPGAVAALRRMWKLEGKFIVAYSGNLGRVHDLDPVIEVAEKLRDDARIAFLLIGGGAQRAKLESRVKGLHLTNVLFHPAQPRRMLAETLAVADIHFVTLLPGCEGLVFPSKLYGIAATSRPVVFIGPPSCELARILTQNGLGLVFSRDEIEAISTAIRGLSDRPAKLGQLAASAGEFGKAHLGPVRAADVWQPLLIPTAESAS